MAVQININGYRVDNNGNVWVDYASNIDTAPQYKHNNTVQFVFSKFSSLQSEALDAINALPNP